MGARAQASPARRVSPAGRASALGGAGIRLRLRGPREALLRRAGQPQRRARAWTYCVDGAKGAAGVTAVFTPGGSVGLVASTARGHRIGNVVPGTRSGSLRGRARRISPTLWVGGRGSTRFVYRVVKGRVQPGGVTTRSIAKSRARLTAYLKLVQRSVPAPPPLVPRRTRPRPRSVGARRSRRWRVAVTSTRSSSCCSARSSRADRRAGRDRGPRRGAGARGRTRGGGGCAAIRVRYRVDAGLRRVGSMVFPSRQFLSSGGPVMPRNNRRTVVALATCLLLWVWRWVLVRASARRPPTRRTRSLGHVGAVELQERSGDPHGGEHEAR